MGWTWSLKLGSWGLKMKILSDYHNHSIYSGNKGHATSSLEEVVQAARARGLKEVLITDHGPGHLSYGIDRKKLAEIRKEIDRLKDLYPDMEIGLGVEANIVGSRGQIDVKKEDLKYFDKVNVGYHYGVFPKDLKFLFSFFILNKLAGLFKFLGPWSRKLTTKAMIRVVEENTIFMVTHPGAKAPINVKDLAEVCARRGTALEINSSGHGKLSVEDIREAMETDVLFTLGSDSHWPERVGDLDFALRRVKEAGLGMERIINKKED